MRPSLRSLIGCGCLLLGAALGWCLSASHVGAQQGKSFPEIVSKWTAKPEFQAKIEAIQGGTIVVQTFGTEPVTIHIPGPPITKTLSVKGTGELSAIKTGMGMRFAGKVDETGVVAEKVSEFYLVTIDFQLPEVIVNEDAEIVGKITSFDPKTNTIKLAIKGAKKELKGEKEITTYPVKLATLTLADGAKINVDLKDLSLAHKNDMITVSGRVARVLPANTQELPNTIIAESVVIELAEPLSFGKKRVTPAGKNGKTEKANPFAPEEAKGEEKKEEMKKDDAKKVDPKKVDPKKAADKKAA